MRVFSIPETSKAGTQTIRGNNAIGVQVEGDSNSVTIIAGSSRLVLDKPHKRRGADAPANERQLLVTERRFTTLVGRDDALKALAAWRDEDRRIAIRCTIGRAGSGKTRLAIEACERAEASGWTAGFVSGDELRRFDNAQNLSQWRPSEDTLIVVDDAAISAAILKRWLTALARRPARPDEKKLRILLLERHADADSAYGWWAELRRNDSRDHAGAGDLIAGEGPVLLPVIAEAEARRALLAEAMSLAAAFLNRPALAPPPAGSDPDFDRRLADDRLENEPLFLLMAGIVAAERGAPAALALGRIELAKEMADSERARLARLGASRGLPADGHLIAHLAACATLQRGCDLTAADVLVNEEVAAMGFISPSPANELVDLLADALPGPAGAEIDRVRPDLIGEAFLIQEVTGRVRRADDARLAIVERARRRDEPHVLETLVLAVQDFAGGATDHPAMRWLTELANRSAGLEELANISDAIPPGSSALCELGARVDERLAELVRRKGVDEDAPLLAFVLARLADRLNDLKEDEAALAAAQEAVGLYRPLALAQPGFNPDLAKALTSFACFLSTSGRDEDALAPAQEAVDLLRSIASRRLGFLPDLARSLAILADVLSELNQPEAALAASEQVVDLDRLLAKVRPDAFNAALALSLGSLASRLIGRGRHEAAVAAGREVVGRCRILAAAEPDRFNPTLAASLANLAISLRALKEHDAALAAVEEAVVLHRALAAARPAASHPDLARSLATLAAILFDLGRYRASADASREAIDLLRTVAGAGFEAANSDLARSLTTLAGALNQLREEEPGQEEAALAAAQEAVDRFRTLAATEPDTFDAELAAALTNLLQSQYAVCGNGEAFATAQEMVELRRRLAAASPALFCPDLAISLSMLAVLLEEEGRLEEGVALRREAVFIVAPCFLASPAQFGDVMRTCAAEYLRRVDAAGLEPDLELIEPIVAKFKEGGTDDAD